MRTGLHDDPTRCPVPAKTPTEAVFLRPIDARMTAFAVLCGVLIGNPRPSKAGAVVLTWCGSLVATACPVVVMSDLDSEPTLVIVRRDVTGWV